MLVTQPYESPDFRLETRRGNVAWVEAVTANPADVYNHVNAPLSSPPRAREERFFGSAAVRFAKTLGNKLTRRYDRLPHVACKSFIIAIADFQAPASMVWSHARRANPAIRAAGRLDRNSQITDTVTIQGSPVTVAAAGRR